MFKKSFFIAISLISLFNIAGYGQKTIVKYLSGKGNNDTVTWDFYCTGGRHSGQWTTIGVPSCWQFQGFGTYNYGFAKHPSDNVGIYKYHFKADKKWKHKQVYIVFEGSMTDTKVEINGKPAGPLHQGAFYQFQYNITPLLKYGKTNLLEAWVRERSANASVNRAERSGDFWIFGGIFRPVYLKVVPDAHIKRVAVNAKADGRFSMDIFLDHINKDGILEASIEKVDGSHKSKSFSVPVHSHDSMITMTHQFHNMAAWSPEYPNLYTVKVFLKNKNGKVVHMINQRFGFRDFEFRPHDGFYLNGKKIRFKGVCHHSFWPSSGRTTSKRLSIEDVSLMKKMNMNAVRTSHYPPDVHFLNVCDSLGLLVLDELTGWQHAYNDTAGTKLVKEMVTRDVNHPSVVIWDNGNEGGFNPCFDPLFDQYDPQKRIVIHPGADFDHVDDIHYPGYNYEVNTTLYGFSVDLCTEFLHGLYDGGSGAGLDDYWSLMVHAPRNAGGFLWDFSDGGVMRTDENDSIDTHGNYDADGILGPYRQRGGSFYTIRNIWSPIQINQTCITPHFNGKLLVENRYRFTNLDQCTFKWELVSFGDPYHKNTKTTVDARGESRTVSAMPGERRWMNLQLPSSWKSSDALYLTAWGPHHKKVCTWSWPVHTPDEVAKRWIKKSGSAVITTTNNGNQLVVKNGNVWLFFNKKTGFLEKVKRDGLVLSLSGGPVVAGLSLKLDSFAQHADGKNYIVEAYYKKGKDWLRTKWIFTPGMPVKLSYWYNQVGEVDFRGITFNYPPEKVTGVQWLGRGPYHVWKNRLKGLQFNIWKNVYNDPQGKEGWVYPELKGNLEDVYWARVSTKEFPFTVFIGKQPVFFQILKPKRPIGSARPRNTLVKFPEGDIGFMNEIQPIGTKFKNAKELGPQSMQNMELNKGEPYKGVLWLDFRK